MPQDGKIPPLISLVALVRDEAAELRRLLTWHRDLYDEAVVVDTGSLDASVTVAEECGARVTHFAWCDDFSAARNHGLKRARGRWVLVLDCDEVIAKEDFERVRGLCRQSARGWGFEQWNYCEPLDDPQWCATPDGVPTGLAGASGYIGVPTCRLFPNRPELRYEGLVHELPDQGLARAGLAIEPCQVVVHHYGHLVSGAVAERKKARYATLLRKKLKANPQDIKARYEMALQLTIEQHYAVAQQLLERTLAEHPEHEEIYRIRLLLGRIMLGIGDKGAAVRHTEAAVHQWPAFREGWCAAVSLHWRLHDRGRATAFLEQGLGLFPDDAVLLDLKTEMKTSLVEPQQCAGQKLGSPRPRNVVLCSGETGTQTALRAKTGR